MESFAAACRVRVPTAEVTVASAESLPFPDDSFDATLSQPIRRPASATCAA